MSFVVANWLTLTAIFVMLILWFLDRETAKDIIKWVGGVLTESDGNGGKASLSRVVGVYATWNIVQQSWISMHDKASIINAYLWDIWVWSIGYMFLSKALSTMSPAILDFAKGYMEKHSKPKDVRPEDR